MILLRQLGKLARRHKTRGSYTHIQYKQALKECTARLSANLAIIKFLIKSLVLYNSTKLLCAITRRRKDREIQDIYAVPVLQSLKYRRRRLIGLFLFIK